MDRDKKLSVFFELVRAGLWEKDVRLASYGEIDFNEIYRIAEEQSVVGLVAAGLEHVVDVRIPQVWALQFAGQTIQLEQRNKAMNQFIAAIVAKMQETEIHTLLVKGQGIAQCYERPLWRSSGDIDLFLDSDSYLKAKAFLRPQASFVKDENEYNRHLEMTIDPWIVELHGTLRSQLGKKIDSVIDEVQQDTFNNESVRMWNNEGVEVFLPSPDNDIIFVFTHILQHYFIEGVGVRQICDWCRLLWTFKDTINKDLLETRIKAMGIMTEWRVFGELGVKYLGMPLEAMPLYVDSTALQKKADNVMSFVIEVGNFGHNRDLSEYSSYSFVKRKIKSFLRHSSDSTKQFSVFPKDTTRVWLKMIINGFKN